ncbi:Putative epoxidase LasC [Streptomyces antimycoticus]
MRTPAHAVVLGGGLAGTLAAAALSSHMDKVTIVERHHLPDGPGARRGVPQARHAHLMWSGGARAIESLLSGTIRRWTAAGARQIGVPSELVSLTAQGWLRRGPRMQFIIICSRDLLDWVVRKEVLANDRITLAPPGRAVALLGSPARVTGVRVRDEVSGRETELGPAGRRRHRPQLTGRPVAGEPGFQRAGREDCRLRPHLRVPGSFTPRKGCRQAPLIDVQADHLTARPGKPPPSSPSKTADGWSPSPAPGAVSPPPTLPTSSTSRAACATPSSAT